MGHQSKHKDVKKANSRHWGQSPVAQIYFAAGESQKPHFQETNDLMNAQYF
jgi:hypothetical protein